MLNGLCEIHKSLILEGDNLTVTEVHSTGLYCTGNGREIHKFHGDLNFAQRLVSSEVPTEKTSFSPSVVPEILPSIC